MNNEFSPEYVSTKLSRADFFKSFIPKRELNIDRQGQELSKKSFSREQFLEFCIALGGVIALTNFQPVYAAGGNKRSISHERSTISEVPFKPTYTQTALETSLLFTANTVVNGVCQSLHIPTSNERYDRALIKRIQERPFKEVLLRGGVLSPVAEEAVFRLLPSKLFSGISKDDMWNIGIPTNVIFALLHNRYQDPDTKHIIFDTEKIPLTEFIAGLFFWKLMRERGFSHAALAHSTYNVEGLTIAKLLLENFPNR